jgi:hypothetical protein
MGISTRRYPAVVEAQLGVREYWYHTFYRAVVVPVKDDTCYLISMDLYVHPYTGPGEPVARLEPGSREARVALEYYEVKDRPPPDVKLKPVRLELVVLSYDDERELIGARALVCNVDRPPSYDEVKELYDWLSKLTGFKPSRPQYDLEALETRT